MGPLSGVRVLEMAGLGPAPLCCMILADLGADVVRVDRPQHLVQSVPGADFPEDPLSRGRRSVAFDLKTSVGQAAVLGLATRADVLIEGFRPGVMERLGLGPDDCAAVNPRLVYGRMTGWGQDGPLAPRAGHDINYLAMSGTLHAIGRKGEAPVLPLNLVADYGGGAMMLAVGVLAAVIEARSSGRGQVVDAAMVDGVALLSTVFHGLLHTGFWKDERGSNLIDGGCFFYDVYETADGGYMAVGALEAKFFAELLIRLGLEAAEFADRDDPASWPRHRATFTALFRSKSRAEWERIFDGSDACVSPVLSLREAQSHPANRARGMFIDRLGVTQPAPAPRFSRSETGITRDPPEVAGADQAAVFADWGVPLP
ncbi:CaiB/BaiF CoA transferase family protein [Govanella unica]|uniref:CoA transferase n=1 Tax=Govanella unica TaxID=2975056 RepID=A0A9X3TZP1_9PROT|nr:CaiB/BaiF CoA-transferase family protein [Govania unica]MDA5194743.1 CoA transferase [Govania unica]